MKGGNIAVDISFEFDENGLFKAEASIHASYIKLHTIINYKLKFDSNEINSKVHQSDFKKYAIGIDLGTTNSAVGFWCDEKVQLVENIHGMFNNNNTTLLGFI